MKCFKYINPCSPPNSPGGWTTINIILQMKTPRHREVREPPTVAELVWAEPCFIPGTVSHELLV